MPILVDHLLREQLEHLSPDFPIVYFHDEMADLPVREGPVHWHPEFEIATAKTGVLDYQVGENHLRLDAGDTVFVCPNMLHRICQTEGSIPDPMPGIVFPGTLVAPETSRIYQTCVQPLLAAENLPFILIRRGTHGPVLDSAQRIYSLLETQAPFYEIRILRELLSIFTYLNEHFDEWPRMEASRVQTRTQIRVQQMLSFIYAHYAEKVSLKDIASAAHISRSEAARCFDVYLHCTPVEALTMYRLQQARVMLMETPLAIQEISGLCGFHSAGYFTRQFRRYYGYAPGKVRGLGKSC